MRTKEEIKKDRHVGLFTNPEQEAGLKNQWLIIEVLLDIRDLLRDIKRK